MPTKAVFHCQFCDATPDHGTQRSLQGQVTERMFGEYLDAFPGRWLVWNGGGTLGPRRYACRMHRGDLVAYLRYHYATVAAQVWKMPPYEQRWPDEKRPHMGGSMGIVKFGLRGGLLQDTPREKPPEKETSPPADDLPAAAPPPAGDAAELLPASEPSLPADTPPAHADLFPPGELFVPEDQDLPPARADLFPPGELFVPEDMLGLGGGPEPLEDMWPSDEQWPGATPDDPWPGGLPPDEPPGPEPSAP
jgi:hypothetical protein